MEKVMKAIIVEPDEVSREYIRFLAETIDGLEIVCGFNNMEDAVAYIEHNEVDLALLDVHSSDVNGNEVRDQFYRVKPDLLLIYLIDPDAGTMDTENLRTAAYLVMPVTPDDLEYAVESARLMARRDHKRVYVRTFGYFDVFVNGKPMMFKSSKAKELLALLVDRRGGTVNSDQIISVLWEDRPNDESTQSLCSKIVKTLKSELDEHGIGNILIQKRGIRSIDVRKIDCDMFEFLNGKATKQNQFMGDYMLEYSWAEDRLGVLWKRAEMYK